MKKVFVKYFISLLIIISPVKLLSQVHVSLPDTSAKKNTFIFIPVNVTDLTKKGVKSYNFTVPFNSNILKAEGYSTKNSLSDTFTWNVKSEIRRSSIKIEASGIFALSGKGTLIFLKFKVVGNSGSSKLTFKSFTFNSGSPSAIKHNGKFTVYVEKRLKIEKVGNGEGKISVNDIEYKLPYEKLLKTNETYKLLAIPSTGSKFAKWDGDIESTNNPYYLKLEDDTDIDVRFNLKHYTITLLKEPSEGGNVSGDGNYEYGKNVIIKAESSDNWKFENWTEDGIIISDSFEYEFIAEKNRTLTANFSNATYMVSGNVEPLNAGYIDGLGEYSLGTVVTLTAEANEGWSFLEWRDSAVDSILSNNPVLEVVVNGNLNLTAKFSKNLYSVLTTSNPSEGGIASGGGYFYLGQKAQLYAAPNKGWEFINWTLNGNEVSDKENIEIEVNGNISYVANFKSILYSLTTSAEPIESGIINGSGLYYYNQIAIVTANPNAGWKFDNWMNNDSIVSTDLSYEIIIKKNTILKANFSLVTDIDKINDNIKFTFLNPPFPNPFNPSTTFKFEISTESIVNLSVYNLNGELVLNLINNEHYVKGKYSKILYADKLSSGVYFYKFTSLAENTDNNVYKTGKILLLR